MGVADGNVAGEVDETWPAQLAVDFGWAGEMPSRSVLLWERTSGDGEEGPTRSGLASSIGAMG